MKQLLKRTLSFLLVSAIVCTLFSGVFTASAASYSYNSGKRGELCTALSAQAKSYYTGSYTYDKLSSLSAASLRTTLRSLVTNGRTTVGYGGLRDYHKYTDAYQGSSSKLVLFYCNGAANSAWDSGKTWNREHMWPDSLGGSAMEGDLHAMRPTDPNLNSTRGNKRYGEVNNGTAAKAGSNNGSLLGGYSGSNAFEPLDFAKGDCARVVLYDYVVTNSMSSVTTVFTDIDTLLAWCLLDPVDEFEMSRNDVAQEIENCRNPFVDYPELAWILFGKAVPAGMPSPSGSMPACQHTATHTVTTDPTCTANGKIETVCNACGEVIATETLAKLGHKYEMTTVEPTCSEKGYDLYSCIRCDNTYKENYTDTVDHIDTDGDLACDYCGTEVIPVCTHENTHEERTEPTCEKAGSVKTICDACGETVATETLAKLGHEYEMTTVEPTCTEKGYDLYSCIRCDDEYKKNYTDKLAHDFHATTVAPTCSERGYDLYVCILCNAEYKNNYTDKVDHIDEDGNNACDFCGKEMESGTTPPNPDPCPCEDYIDIGELTWYHDSAVYAIENGLMNGVAPGRFDPNGIVTRAMLVTILYRLEGETSVEGLDNPFADVAEGQWYTNAIIWAADSGLVNGVSPTSFAPNQSITREQIAAILYRYAQFKEEDVTCDADMSVYPDTDEISAYAVDAIRWAVGNEIINGISGTISPVAIATRAQIAAMLMRYLEK